MAVPASFLACSELMAFTYDAVPGDVFYRFIFPDNENSGEQYSDFSHPNAIYLFQDEADRGSDRRLRRRIMLNDTWEQDYMDYVEENPMTLCSGLTFRSRSNKLENAQNMNALIFDLDGVGLAELRSILERFTGTCNEIRSIPKPTFLVLSGRGVHLYYVFDEPIALYPNIKLQLKALKYDLTFRIWDYKGTSQVESIQYQSIAQGFRMVGSVNSKYGNTVKAYRVGDRVSLDYLNSYVKPDHRVDLTRPFRPSRVDRATAAELYPEWYQRVVVEGQKARGKWDIAGKVHGDNPYALYDWWRRQIGQIRGGHRYFFLLCLVIYACKCNVPKKKLKEDMQECFEILRGYQHENALTEEDMESALECYSRDYYNFTIDDIELLTDVRIEKNKRNGRKQEQHLAVMRAVQATVNPNWRNTDGRPSAEQIIKEWQVAHPNGKQKECEAETGLCHATVSKWWQRLDPFEIIREWKKLHPNGSKSECHESTGLSYPTIRKWWDVQERKKVSVMEPKKANVMEMSDTACQNTARSIIMECEKMAAKLGITPEEAYKIYLENPANVRLTKPVPKKTYVDPDWHTDLPEYFVIEGEPNQLEKLLRYASMGIRNVPILSEDEYTYLYDKQTKQLREMAARMTFTPDEVSPELLQKCKERGIELRIVSEEEAAEDLVMGWLNSIKDNE